MNAREEISDSVTPEPESDPPDPGCAQHSQPSHGVKSHQPRVQFWTKRCAAAHGQLTQPYNRYSTQEIGDQRQAHRNKFTSVTGRAPESLAKPPAHAGGEGRQHQCADNHSEASANGREYEAPILVPWNSNEID